MKDHYAILFDDLEKPYLHVCKNEIIINVYIEDIVKDISDQYLDPNSPDFINK